MAQEILTIDPAFSIAGYAESQPYKDADTLRRLMVSLRQAGLPDSA
jgi:hypothetical protein